jgi:transcription initiation factor TFIIH subunit 4
METRIPTITSAGFQFVLHTPNDQLWDLLLQYFHLAEVFLYVHNIVNQLIVSFQERQMDLVEVLGFIFMLSTMELGRVIIFSTSSTNVDLMATRQEYSTENLSGTQKAMLEDLRDYGLIWQRKV